MDFVWPNFVADSSSRVLNWNRRLSHVAGDKGQPWRERKETVYNMDPIIFLQN
jgi:hypothetical protein